MDIENIIKSMSDTQKKNIIKMYEYRHYKIGTGLKTGNTLMRKGLVQLSEIQLKNWTMYKITELGITVAEKIKNS